jgi:hypothetical protein
VEVRNTKFAAELGPPVSSSPLEPDDTVVEKVVSDPVVLVPGPDVLIPVELSV